ncbi:MAG TPA: response regulator [Candidatus Acidoferrum sp.]|nr:response regulator [Candidatus Acidoferrum sp.]
MAANARLRDSRYTFRRIASAANKDFNFGAVSRSVLIADDSASMRRSVRFLLERHRIELRISEAVDGADAIEKARGTKPDLILLDLAMPRLNGVEAASILQGILPNTPIILFTMHTDLHADSLSAFIKVDFVSKVDGVSRLLERVDTLLPPIVSDDGVALH